MLVAPGVWIETVTSLDVPAVVSGRPRRDRVGDRHGRIRRRHDRPPPRRCRRASLRAQGGSVHDIPAILPARPLDEEEEAPLAATSRAARSPPGRAACCRPQRPEPPRITGRRMFGPRRSSEPAEAITAITQNRRGTTAARAGATRTCAWAAADHGCRGLRGGRERPNGAPSRCAGDDGAKRPTARHGRACTLAGRRSAGADVGDEARVVIAGATAPCVHARSRAARGGRGRRSPERGRPNAARAGVKRALSDARRRARVRRPAAAAGRPGSRRAQNRRARPAPRHPCSPTPPPQRRCTREVPTQQSPGVHVGPASKARWLRAPCQYLFPHVRG